MDTQTLSVIAAVIGFLMTIVFIILGILGVKSLSDIRDQLRKNWS